MTEDVFSLPASVAAYLSSPAVRTGVDALLSISADALPEGLEWHELDDYLAARAAAELTRSEWAIMVQRLWQSVWGVIEQDNWRPAPLEELEEYEYAVTPATCWGEQRFALWHTRRPLTLYTAVRVTRSTTQIAFSLEGRKPLLRDDDEHFTWTDTKEWEGWLVATVRCSPAAPEFNISVLKTVVETALRRIREAAPPQLTAR